MAEAKRTGDAWPSVFRNYDFKFGPSHLMPAVVLNLDEPDDLALVNGKLKWAPGLVPGEPNEGLVAGKYIESPPRLKDFDDSNWEEPKNIRDVVGTGFTFAWYRFTITLPEKIKHLDVAGAQIWFETSSDDYGEIWMDCPPFREDFLAAQAIKANHFTPVTGYNARDRILVTNNAEVGKKHVIACLAINAPIAQPLGGTFIRYARLEVCQGVAKIPV